MDCSLDTEPLLGLGIDGCRAGWIAVSLERQQHRAVTLLFRERVEALLEAFPGPKRCFIDIPIGLADHSTPRRSCDIGARALLGAAGSRVFPAPTRFALAAADHRQASDLNERITGMRVSAQCYHLFPKIREVDQLLRAKGERSDCLLEAHPEVAFAQINRGRPVLASKKTAEGRLERLRLLDERWPGLSDALETGFSSFRGFAAPDDLVDAAVLALHAVQPEASQRSLFKSEDRDEAGIRRAIHYAEW